jgi:ABC-type nitrate/sulfonate/bicarbonate transport system permease component
MTTWARRVNWLGILVVFVLLAVWEVLVDTKIIHYAYVPAPIAIASSSGEMISSGILFSNLGHTIVATLIGWVVAAIVGVGLGVLLGLSRVAWVYSMSSIDALRSLPVVAFVPVAVIIFGFSIQTEWVVAAYAAVWPILLNTLAGIRDTNPRLIEVGRSLQLTRTAQLWKLRLPAATAHIVTGLRLGLAVSLVLVLVAEMVGNPKGIGYQLITDSNALQPKQMFVSIVTIGIAGMILNSLLMLLARTLARGQMASAGETS